MRRVAYITGSLVLAVFLGVALLLLATGIEHHVSTELPKPTGPFAVGRTMFDWKDADAGAGAAADPGAGAAPANARELVAWVWYPARTCEGKRAEYLPAAWRDALASAGGVLMTDFLTRDLARVQVHACEDADLAPGPDRFPVVILRAGGGAPVADFSALAEHLASHGYVVVGADAPGLTTVVVFPDGRVVRRAPQYDLENFPEARQVQLAAGLVRRWDAHIDFMLYELASLDIADPYRRFTGRLDLDRVGIAGHSLGGATAADFCHRDPRCRAGVDIDGRLFGPVVAEGVRQPFLFVLEDHHGKTSPTVSGILAQIQSAYEHSAAETRLRISIAGANHFSFGDQILLKSQLLLGLMRTTGVVGSLAGPRGIAITNDYVNTFFDVYLKGQPRAELDSLAHKYSEVVVE